MRRLFIILAIILLPTLAQAEPWLVCDPQSDATGYIYNLNNGADVVVPYATKSIGGVLYAVVTDVSWLPSGPFTFKVRAYKDDPKYGRFESASVPFSDTKPSIGTPSGMGIKR